MFAKIRKIVLVIIITALIWVWADQALTRELDGVPAAILVDKSTDSHLWVSFDGKNSSVPIKLKLSGPAGKIDALEKKLREKGTLGFDFYFNAAEEKMADPGKHPLSVVPFVRNSRIIQESGLEVEASTPKSVEVQVVQLVNQRLTVQVLSDTQVLLTDAIVEPAAIEMLVRQDYAASAIKATVVLTQQEIDQARVTPIQRKPVVELGPGVPKPAETSVKITLPPTENRLTDYTIDAPNIGYTFSPNLQGDYKVELINQGQIIGALKIRATPDAKAAFDLVPYKLRLDIIEDDKKAAGDITRDVQVNLPDDYIRKGEIMVNEAAPRQAKFHLVPMVSPADKAAAPQPAAELKTGP